MRLLHSDLGGEAAPILEEFYDDIPPYAILSHRWGKVTEEVSFKDIENGADISKKEGFKKLKYCCQQALEEGYSYVWIDTCCIDNSSSAELSEAINSIYNYYMNSRVCYAYLNDVSCPDSWNSEDTNIAFLDENSSFRKSAWFTRGWKLQELIAPRNVMFFDKDWQSISYRHWLSSLVSEITRIDPGVLTGRGTPASVAQRMSWAAGRKTTRVEDRAYSLMGIFGVNMPPLYGEGPRAFIRLQEEIMRQSFDHSLFAWQPRITGYGLLAESPDQFSDSGNIVRISYDKYVLLLKTTLQNPDYAQTNFGTRIHLPLERTNDPSVYRAYLACTRGKDAEDEQGQRKSLVYIYLLKKSEAGLDTYRRHSYGSSEQEPSSLTPANIQAETIYIPHSRGSRFEQMPSPSTHIEVGIKYPNASRPGTCYYYDGNSSGIEVGVARIDILVNGDEHYALVIHLGFFVKPEITGEIGLPVNVYASLGIYKGYLWTDMHDQRGGSPFETLKQLHAKCLEERKARAIPWVETTERQWQAWPTIQKNGDWRYYGSVKFVKESQYRYHARVNFSATDFQAR